MVFLLPRRETIMPTIEKRKSRGKTVYNVKVRLKGYPAQSATFTKLSEARNWGQVTEAMILEGRFTTPQGGSAYTLNDLIDRYMVEVIPHKKPSTAYSQTQQLKWWGKNLGKLELDDITPFMIAKYRDRLLKKVANATVNRYLAGLSHLFTVAVKDFGWMDDNPCRKVRKAKEPRGRVRYLSDDERARLLEACRESRSPYLYAIVVLALSTGARRGEILGMTWDQVDLGKGAVYLEDTKNGDRRTLHLTGHALEVMRCHVSMKRGGTNLVFPGRNGTSPIRIRAPCIITG